MDCEKARDHFSSLLEGELNPLDEQMLKEHLSSCEECQKEWKRFSEMMRWVHSVDEEEVPEGFLLDIKKKMGERKERGLSPEKGRWRGFKVFPSLKIPIQAVAMVAIVFLALYLTKMMPVETPHKKEVKQVKAPYSEEGKKEMDQVTKEVKGEGVAKKPSEDTSRLKDFEQAKAPVPEEKGMAREAYVSGVKDEEKRMGEPSPKTEMAAVETPRPKEMEKVKAPLLEERKIERELVKKEKISLAAKPPRKITLKVSDREKALFQLQELVKQFGGEMITEERNVLFASLPVASFSEFEKGLVELSSSTKADKLIPQKEVKESFSVASGAKRREGEEKGPARSMIDKEGYIAVRILLVEE